MILAVEPTELIFSTVMIRISAVFFLIVLNHLFGFDFHDFEAYQNRYTREQVERKIKTYLEKDSAIQTDYELTSDTLILEDYILHLRKEPLAAASRKSRSLRGAKIAIDPGHFGGRYAELKQRSEEKGKEQSFHEILLKILKRRKA